MGERRFFIFELPDGSFIAKEKIPERASEIIQETRNLNWVKLIHAREYGVEVTTPLPTPEVQ